MKKNHHKKAGMNSNNENSFFKYQQKKMWEIFKGRWENYKGKLVQITVQ